MKVVVTSNKNDLNKNCWTNLMILVENRFYYFKNCYEYLKITHLFVRQLTSVCSKIVVGDKYVNFRCFIAIYDVEKATFILV